MIDIESKTKVCQKTRYMLNKNNNNKDVDLFQDWLGGKESQEGMRGERGGKNEKRETQKVLE